MSDASNGAGRALVSVVVPVFNEAATVGQVVDELLALELPSRSCSSTTAPRTARRPSSRGSPSTHAEVKVLTQPRNRGKGAAVRRGITESTGDILLIQDADLEYSPTDIPALIDPLLTRQGRRRLRHPPARRRAPAARAPVLALRRQPLPDAAGQRALQHDDLRHGGRLQGLPRRARARPDLISDDFRIEPELTAKVLRLGPGIRLYEVPISYYGRSYAEGKKITWRDGFGAVGALLRFRFF